MGRHGAGQLCLECRKTFPQHLVVIGDKVLHQLRGIGCEAFSGEDKGQGLLDGLAGQGCVKLVADLQLRPAQPRLTEKGHPQASRLAETPAAAPDIGMRRADPRDVDLAVIRKVLRREAFGQEPLIRKRLPRHPPAADKGEGLGWSLLRRRGSDEGFVQARDIARAVVRRVPECVVVRAVEKDAQEDVLEAKMCKRFVEGCLRHLRLFALEVQRKVPARLGESDIHLCLSQTNFVHIARSS